MRAVPADAKRARVVDEEWIGGRFSMPTYVKGDVPYRPEVLVWGCPDGIVGMQLVEPDRADDELCALLLESFERPKVGAPRMPRRVRVALPAVAERLRASLGASCRVSVGPTPEIDELAGPLRDFLERGTWTPPGMARGPSYLEDGKVDVEALRAFFAAAVRLHRSAPWDVVPTDSDTIALDLTAFGLERMCVSIIGQAGESFGAIVFESFADFRGFRDRIEAGHMGFGARTLSISFDPIDEMPERMRLDIEEHSLPFGSPEACPLLMPTDADGTPRPIDAETVLLAHACASALARWFERHRTWTASPGCPVIERFTLDDVPGAPEAVVTAPHPGGARGGPRRAPTRPAVLEPKIDLARVRPTTDLALGRVCHELWVREFVSRHREEVDAAIEEMEIVAGRPLEEEDMDALGSMTPVWAALWRPMADGRRGVDLARRFAKLKAPVLAAAVDRLACARGTLIEVVSIDRATQRMVARDLFDGTRYEMVSVAQLLPRITRWVRAFVVLVDIGDGTWMFPSVFMALASLTSLPPREFVDRIRRALEVLGEDPAAIDPIDPHAGLARWAGVAMAAALVMPLPEAEAEERAKRMFAVTSEGEPVLFHEGRLRLPKAAAARFVKAARGASDFMVSGASASAELAFVDRALVTTHEEGETLGTIDVDGGTLRATASSKGRWERLLARLAELAGVAPKVIDVKHVRPSDHSANAADADGPGVRRVIVASGLPMSRPPAPAALGKIVLSKMRAELDREVPMLGGVPRALVATEEGRSAVEAWLREAELHGTPAAESGAFLDLDPLRAELGLAPAAGSARSPG